MSKPSLLPTVTLVDGTPRVSSLDIADRFNKTHKDVLRVIGRLVGELEPDFNERNFAPVDYVDAKGESRPSYSLTRDAFSLVVMGFTGKTALAWKVRYIEAFNAMEARLTGQPVPVNMPIGSQKIAPPKPYCTDREMKPLDAAVDAWVKTGKITRLEALARLRTEFGITRYNRYWPAELIEPALQWVRAQSGQIQPLQALPADMDAKRKLVLKEIHEIKATIGRLINEVCICLTPGTRSLVLPADKECMYRTLDQLNRTASTSLCTAQHALYAAYEIGRGVKFTS